MPSLIMEIYLNLHYRKEKDMFKKVNIVFLPLCLAILIAIFEPFANAGMNEKSDNVSKGIESGNFAIVRVTENTDFSDALLIETPTDTGTSTTPFSGLYGYISNNSNGKKIQGAKVSVSGSIGYTTSDSIGWYNINLVQGTYSVYARKTGFWHNTIRNVYVPNRGKRLDIKLRPLSSRSIQD